MPAVLGSVAPGPHHIPPLSSHTPLVGAICEQVVVLNLAGTVDLAVGVEVRPYLRKVRFADSGLLGIEQVWKKGLRVDRARDALVQVDARELAKQLIKVRDIDHRIDLAAGLLDRRTRDDPRTPYAGLINTGLRLAWIKWRLHHRPQAAIVGDHHDHRV